MTNAVAQRDTAGVEKALQDLVRRGDLAFAQFTQAEQRCQELLGSVSAAKGRAALSDEMLLQMEALQRHAHERSVGAFERLLTAILHDVLPGEGAVKFDLAVKNNATWLDVLLEKDGHLENALEGNGGAVANVLSTGLRFAALFRTKNRRLLVLDEPDCWVKPERIPAFVNVIAKVSQTAGFQTFFISHHDPDLFEQAVNVLELGRDEHGKVCVKSESHVGGDWANDEQPGIRAIELTNVRQHENTTLRFRPGATALVGQNNLGKSTALHSALRAVAYGESSDDLIQHGCDEATIVLHLERGRRIVWSRKLKRSPVVLYRLFRGDDLVSEGRPGKRGEAPPWVVSELGISLVDELDVHLRGQKRPVFLLDDTASRRAQVLSVGRESGYLKLLLAEYDALKAEDRETIRQGEAEYARLQWRLRAKPVADALPAQSQRVLASLAVLKSRQAAVESLQREVTQLGLLVDRTDRSKRAMASAPASARPTIPPDPSAWAAAVAALERGLRAAQARSALPRTRNAPGVANPMACFAAAAGLARGHALAGLRLPPMANPPTVATPAEVKTLGAAVRRSRIARSMARKLARAPTLPQAVSPAETRAQLAALSQAAQALLALQKESRAVHEAVAELTAEEEALRAMLGDHCPVCGGHLPEKGMQHAH